MRMIKSYFLIIFTISFLLVNSLLGQSIGNPISIQGKKAWTISATYNYSNFELNPQKFITKRQFFKLAYGLNDFFDIFLIGGRIQMTTKTQTSNLDNYIGKFEYMYGLGLACSIFNYKNKHPYDIWFTIQGIRYLNLNSYIFNPNSDIPELSWTKTIHYDWREIYGSLMLTRELVNRLKFFSGVTFFALQRYDKHREYVNDTWTSPLKSVYQSGLWYGGVVGLSIFLEHRYSIVVESLIFNRNDYQIMVGISQTKSLIKLSNRVK